MIQKPELRRCLTLIKPYIPGKPAAEVERELGLKNVIKLASNENPLGPAPLALQALRQSLESLHLYPDGSCYDLRLAIAERTDQAGTDRVRQRFRRAALHDRCGLYQLGDAAVAIEPTFPSMNSRCA